MALVAMWSEEAECTSDEIIENLEKNSNEEEIREFVRDSHNVISQIEINPYQFKASRSYEIRKAFITKNISLFYFVNEEKDIIELYAFWDKRTDPQKLKY